jgi:hypothetical protein
MRLNKRNLNPSQHWLSPNEDAPEKDSARAVSVAAGAALSCEPSASRSRLRADALGHHRGGER